jgi:F0F1-type ATP synthase membrane subunit b/b'
MLIEMLKFGVTAFKAGKGLEGLIDETADKFRQQAKAAEGQPKPPSPEQQKLQAQMQLEQAKMQATQASDQAKAQAEAQKLQMEGQLEQQKMQMQIELEKAKQEYQAQENQLKFQLEAERNAADREMEAKLMQMKMNMERNTALMLAYVNNGAKIEQARISSGYDDGTQAYEDTEDMAKALQHPMQPIADAINQSQGQMAQMISQLMEQQNRPKTIIRDANGKIQGVQ